MNSVVDTNNGSAHHREVIILFELVWRIYNFCLSVDINSQDQNGINFSATEVAKESSQACFNNYHFLVFFILRVFMQLSNADELIVITSQTSRNDTEAGSHCPFQCSNSGKAKDLSNNPPAPFEEESEGDESKNIVFHHSQTVRPESVAQGTVQFNVSTVVS